jgi:hypothetical protein
VLPARRLDGAAMKNLTVTFPIAVVLLSAGLTADASSCNPEAERVHLTICALAISPVCPPPLSSPERVGSGSHCIKEDPMVIDPDGREVPPKLICDY